MGKYEDQLATMGAGTDWNIEKIQTLSLALGTLQRTMANLAASPGWEGASADDASEVFQQLKKKFTVVQDAVSQIETTVSRANTARSDAASGSSDLPSARIDPFWRTAVTAGSVVVHPILGPLASDTALDVIEGFLGNQREDAAKKKVESLGNTLEVHRMELERAQDDLNAVPQIMVKDVKIPNDDDPTGPTMPSGGTPNGGYPRGGYPGGGSTPGSTSGPHLGVFVPTPTDPGSLDPSGPSGHGPDGTGTIPGGPADEYPRDDLGSGPSTPSVDDGGPGYVPGGGAGGSGVGGSGLPDGLGGSSGSGGSSPAGAGVIGGGAGAALLAGSKLAGGGAAGLGGFGGGVGGAGGIGGSGGAGAASGARASGGLLGQAGGAGGGANGANGSAAARAGGASGAAGGRPGMMAGGQQGGATEEKAKGQGLGGYIAPTLDDDDDSGPRSKGAGAGGRG